MLPFIKLPLRFADEKNSETDSRLQPSEIESLISCADGTMIIFKSGNMLTTSVMIAEVEKHLASYWHHINTAASEARKKPNLLIT